jgi:hypothetical protein
MRWAVVAQKDHVVFEIGQVKLGERAPGAEQVHDFHRLHVFDLALARDRDVMASQQRIASDD